MNASTSVTGVYVRLVLVAVVWGGSFIAGSIVAAEMNAPTAALWRYLIATVLLVALAWTCYCSIKNSRLRW